VAQDVRIKEGGRGKKKPSGEPENLNGGRGERRKPKKTGSKAGEDILAKTKWTQGKG